MSQCAVAQNEAGPSSGPSRYQPSVRRCKTVSDASSTHARSSHHTATSTVSTTNMLHQLVLPAQHNKSTSATLEATTQPRDSPVSPSRRGETLRAYSRQRRVFSGSDHRASASPERLTKSLFPPGPASPSIGRLHRPRHSISSVGFPDVAGARSSRDIDATSNDVASSNACLGLFADDPSSSLSSTPSLTSPTSTLSRSTSLRSAGSERIALASGTRYLSLNGSSDICNTMENLTEDHTVSTWTRKARRWSNSVSRRMSISALNQTLTSTTSPYLKAGLQELRSIFDVDTLGVAVDDQDDDDLEGASPLRQTKRPLGDQDPSCQFGATDAALATALFLRNQAVFQSPEVMSPPMSPRGSSKNRELTAEAPTSRPSLNFTSQVYDPPVSQRRAHSWRKHRSLSTSNFSEPNLLQPVASITSECTAQRSSSSSSSCYYSARNTWARSQSIRTPLVAVALAAFSVVIVCVCALENSIHPDAASLPLTAFMLAQSVFGLVGVLGLAMQRRWVIDLASRLLRAHVLCQGLIALAALRSLSRTAFYHDRFERQGFAGTAAAGVLTSPRFLATADKVLDPHMSRVGSLRDQVMYMCVFVVQAALPLALVLWAQYAVASALSLATRSLPPSRSSSGQTDKQTSQQARNVTKQQVTPTVQVADVDAAADGGHSRRMRFNSENPTFSKGTSYTALRNGSDGWLGFAITRLDINDTAVTAPSKFELDAIELSSRLEHLARVEVTTEPGVESCLT